MSKFELKLPRMGESVAEATLTTWLKEIGDSIEMDEAIFEIATDKVDSEVPSEVDGILVEKCFDIDDVVNVGDVVAIIEVNGEMSDEPRANFNNQDSDNREVVTELESNIENIKETTTQSTPIKTVSASDRFYSPLVKNIAKQEGISIDELDTISGSGSDGRVTKNDILTHLENRKTTTNEVIQEEKETPKVEEVIKKEAPKEQPAVTTPSKKTAQAHQISTVQNVGGDEVIEMTRMGKMIAKHMAESVSTSAHVQSFIEVDVTDIVNWRNKVKDAFEQREGEKLTFTPIFMEAIAKALKKYPMMNVSLNGDKVIKKKNINIGMAAALPDGNLIVPVIKNADQLNMVGMAKVVNDLAVRSRNNALKPDEVQDGTYTVTNIGSFGSVFGTPIINQPQVGILALGAIRKIPAVIETDEGDFIGIRHKMFLSHSYDHRVVNGALGSMFVKAVSEYLEAWDVNREI
ncbi:2-oxo acid dehydrogenase subunit E2 [Aurantibacter crassamenti]|uniref:dihydrolipoamide acetyltransferase family protein n=1 Tax=Aurantibacter crassamenti TaxID=1837375 RepID=UPI00193994B0|nr:dihydrolipoamide acetyltransferase family protein [Aurantibacter crassamenti]MBM1106346.1 2-oxo acid dehydrogenase subunit E2 [Aurantibacter crassamenti]